MAEKIKHLRQGQHSIMCGAYIGFYSKIQIVNVCKNVTCKRCMKSERYKKYLQRNPKEKLVAKLSEIVTRWDLMILEDD